MRATEKDLVFLRSSPLFAMFSPADIRRFSDFLKEERYEEGQIIIWEGSSPRALYIVAEGTAVVSKVLRGEVESVLARLGPGSHFGELGMIDGQPAACNVSAEERTRVFIIDVTQLESLLRTNSALFGKLAWAMMRDLALKLRATNFKVQEAIEWGLDAASLDPVD